MAGTIREWASANDPAFLFMVLPEEIPNLTKGLPQYQTYGDALVRALDDVIVAGHFPAYNAGEEPPPPVSEIVYHVQERAGTSGTFTAAPGGTGLTDTQFQRVLSALAEGTRQFRVQAEDLSDGAVSAWSTTRSITVDHPAEEPPPPPPPAGTFLAIDGEIYRVLALDPAHEPEAVAAVTVERAFDGTLLTGTVGTAGSAVARGAWRATLWLTEAETSTLRAALALRQRVVVGGDYIGETATATGVLESATLDESWAGGTPTRTVQAVVRLEAI